MMKIEEIEKQILNTMIGLLENDLGREMSLKELIQLNANWKEFKISFDR